MDIAHHQVEGRLTVATAIVRDPSIAGHDRWATNERAQASLSVENSALRRVSAWPLLLLLPLLV